MFLYKPCGTVVCVFFCGVKKKNNKKKKEKGRTMIQQIIRIPLVETKVSHDSHVNAK